MGGNAKGAMLVGSLLIAFMATVPPAVFEGKSVGWGVFIYDYQGLIGGVLAVLAAVLTVQQMHAAEDQANKRFQRSLAEGRRNEIRTIEHAANAVKEIKAMVEAMEKFEKTGVHEAEYLAQDIHALMRMKWAIWSCLKVKQTLQGARINAVKVLFPMYLDALLEECLRYAEFPDTGIPTNLDDFSISPKIDAVPEWYDPMLAYIVSDLLARIAEFIAAFEVWSDREASEWLFQQRAA